MTRTKRVGQKKGERPQERGWDAMQPNRLDAGKLAKSSGGKTSRTQEKGKATAEMGRLREEGYEKIGGG